MRQERSRPLIIELEAWLREQRAKLSRNNDTTKAINYCLSRWDAFTRFLDDGRLCMSTDGVEKPYRQFKVTFLASPSRPPPSARTPARRVRHSQLPAHAVP